VCVCAVVVCKVYYTALLEAARLHTLPRLIRLFTLLTHILPFPVFLFCSFYFCHETLIRAGFVLLFYQLRFRDDPPLRLAALLILYGLARVCDVSRSSHSPSILRR
jgi:hypothetical protein